MGKASRWMIKLLLGKKEEKSKYKNKNICFYDENVTTPSSTPTFKRWSFRKSATKDTAHKFSKSLDSITPLITQHAAAALDWEIQPKNKTNIATVKRVASKRTANGITKSLADAAATQIQAAFRSYLAKKALSALRGLVKIQALVRGHLVRKQTTATLRQMHALMTIQVRARFQRIQMVEESSQLNMRSQSSRLANLTHETAQRAAFKEAIDLNIYETERTVKPKHDYSKSLQIENGDHRPRKQYYGELSVSNRDQQYEFFFSTAHNSPQIHSPTATAIPGRASFTYKNPDYVHDVPSPNYMSYTESSRAKIRSQSEPKQRPTIGMRPKSKRADSVGGISDKIKGHSITHENEDPWFIKLFNTTKREKSDYDAKSTASPSHSDYSKLLATYEPHLNLY